MTRRVARRMVAHAASVCRASGGLLLVRITWLSSAITHRQRRAAMQICSACCLRKRWHVHACAGCSMVKLWMHSSRSAAEVLHWAS